MLPSTSTWPGCSSPRRPSTTSCSCRSRSGWPSWWPSCRPCGTARAIPEQRRLTRFFGTLLLINVAIGVVTGLVQEFEFGMNWSAYSRFVGDVFGAPLAMEGLAAFFLESTFLGLWLFGWDRLPKRVHLACIWMVAVGTLLSAAFIMAANSWMQHPVGYTINSKTGRAAAQQHRSPCSPTRCSCGATPTCCWPPPSPGRSMMLAVSAWHLRRGSVGRGVRPARPGWLAGGAAAGHRPGHVRRQRARGRRGQVPAHEDRGGRGAVEHLPAVLVLAVPDRRRQGRRDADPDHRDPPSAVAAGHQLTGTARSRASTRSTPSTSRSTGPATTSPTCSSSTGRCGSWPTSPPWSCCSALWGAWAVWRHRLERSRWFLLVATWAAIAPFFMNTAGWLLTENGRQPWIVQGLMKTSARRVADGERRPGSGSP